MLESKYIYNESELLYFHNGYAYGGSTSDQKHKNKQYRAEDCLTSVIRWLRLEEKFNQNELLSFSTLDLEKFFFSDIYHPVISNRLQPLANFSKAKVGDLFLYREYDIQKCPDKNNYNYSIEGRIGFISEITSSNNFEHVSYTRNIPLTEDFSLHTRKHVF